MIYILSLLLILLSITDASAVTRYLSSSGSDSNTCAQSQSSATPKATFSAAKACMSAGDTMKILAGSTFTGTQPLNLTSLTGTSANPYRIEVDSGTVTFNVTASASACRWIVAGSSTQWVTVSGLNGNLVFNGSACPDNYIGNIADSLQNVTFEGIEITAFKGTGIYISGSTNVTLNQLYVHDQVSPTCASGTRYYGVYIHNGTNITLTKSTITGNPGGGVQVYPGPLTGVTISKNVIASNNSCTSSPVGGIIVANDSSGGIISGTIIKNNLIYGNGVSGGGGGIRVDGGTFALSGTLIYNNTIYDNRAGTTTGYGINVQAGTSSTTIKNNHIVGNATGQINDSGTGTVQSNNRTTGSITDCTPSTSTFTQKASSSCIDAGVDVGNSYNGSAPDIGAFESFVFASCEVPNSAASTIQVTFTNNANAPLGNTLTTFTARLNGSNNALTGAASKIGDNIVSLPLTTTYVGGDTADISWASGGLTDQALIAGTLNQPFVQTLSNQSCTNNAGGAPSYTFTQATYKFHGVYGLEASPDVRSSEGASTFSVVAGGAVRLRFAVTCGGADCPPTGFYLYYSTGGAYASIPSTMGAGNIMFCGTTYVDPLIPTNGVATTNQLSTGGTFVAGAVVFSSNAIPTVTGLNNTYKTELEYCIKFDTDATGSYTFRLYKQDGTALDTYSLTPTITVVDSQAIGGF